MNAGAVYVTGAASGIGLTLARLLVASGSAVALMDVDPRVELVAQALSGDGSAVVGLRCDVRSEAEVLNSFDAAAKVVGPAHGLVTCAGIDRSRVVHELAAEAWDEVLDINLRGTFLACRSALRHMLELGSGAIVCVASPFAHVAPEGGAAAYCASKGGVCALVRSLAVDYGRRGIRVNALLPGPTDTPLMWANVNDSKVDTMRSRLLDEVPLGRLAQPNEPAAAALWLLSDQASYVNGAELVCDAGVLAKASVSI
jgi:NAD(P)-dependent dehydrogenase (short-subunit alcohol dehydrogenase family)